ncbi:Cardiolipin synthetase [Desulfosporosinus sp. I2]|uniref:cardiolipin synthase n=1 Tax=Desulfosporosinus sp. I2 TaxID=1617025 RepID=UPI0005EDE663|nr:cardiolipin synthase [Desulfosporosinus sp. I2]KJR48780.1 Cardiolipin synthetase [Desulfosporosinus sp. I2]
MIWLLLLLISIVQVTLIWKNILLKNQDPGKTIVWFFVLGLLPIFGFLLYKVLGQKTPGKGTNTKILAKDQLDRTEILPQHFEDSEQKLAHLLLKNGQAHLTIRNQVEILLNGQQKFRALFNALEGASLHIHLSYFIFKDDEIGEDVMKILTRKVSEGVEVRVLLDGMGSLSISGGLMKRMRAAGIRAEWFFPIRFPYLTSRLNLRYHRKIVVVDGRIGFTGGLNIGDEYLSRDSKLGFWRDTHLKLQGEAVQSLQAIFLNDWQFVTGEEYHGSCYFPQTSIMQNLPIQILVDGPDSIYSAILQSFFSMITMAKHSIYIETPYFIPDESLIMALKTAALKGLDVRIIVQGIPESKLTYWAMNSYFEDLLQAGVRIFKYMKGTLHAKILLIDNHLASVGSANMDLRSFFLDYEICTYMYDQALTEHLKQNFESDLKESHEVIFMDFQHRSMIDRSKESIARLFSSLL